MWTKEEGFGAVNQSVTDNQKKKKNKKEDVESFSSLTRSLSDTVITA